MSLREDRRGQAIQIGAVLLLGALVIAFSLYQAVVVPDQNRSVEFSHSQQVQGQLQDLRNTLVSADDGGGSSSVAVALGTQYPSRLLALNPSPPSGTLQTVGTGNASVNVTVAGAAATGETGDFWTGAARTYNTGAAVYRPGYNEYGQAPATWYENSVLYNRFGDANLTLTGQRLVDGNRIALVTLNGSYYASRSGTATVDVRPVSAAATTVSVTNDTATSNVTVTVPTRLSGSAWRTLLRDEFAPSGHLVRLRTTPLADGELRLLTLVFERGVSYDLQLARAGVGTGVDTPGPAYLTDVAGNGTTVPEGGTATLTVEVRDALDNPEGGVATVAGTASGDTSVDPNRTDSGSDGELRLTYEAPADISGTSQATDTVNVSIDPNVTLGSVDDADFDPGTARNVSLTVRIDNTDGSGLGGGGGAYRTEWNRTEIATEPGVQGCFAANDTCVYDLGADPDGRVDLTVGTDPPTVDAFVDFTRNNTLGTLTPSENTTGADGEAVTTFAPSGAGVTNVSALTTADGDTLTIRVLDSGGPPTITSVEGDSGRDTVTVSFNEGVYGNGGATQPIDASDLTYYDNNSAGAGAITGVSHTAGSATATLTLDVNTVAGDFGTDAVGAVSGRVYDADGNTADTTPVTLQDTTAPADPTATSGPTITPSNEGSYSVTVGLVDDHEAGTVDVRLVDAGGTSVTGSTVVGAESDGDTSGDSVTVSGIDASSLSDGSIDVSARITDYGGNTNPSGYTATSTVVKDTTPPSVTVDDPNGGETITPGSTYTIQWTATDATTSVATNSIDLAYSTDGGGSYATIATGEANDGAYDWSVPNADTADALVRVTADDTAGNTGSDTSDGTFTIAGDTAPPTVTSASINDSDDTINDSEANADVRRTVSLTFNETMNTSVAPSITYENVSAGSTYSVVSEGWTDPATYTQTLEFADTDVDTPVTTVVSGAEDTDGNVMNTERPLTFDVDTRAPATPNEVYIVESRINITNQNGVTLRIQNPGSLDGDETAVISAVNTTTGDRVTATKQITTGPGDNTTITGVDVSSLPDGTVIGNATIRDDAGNTAGFVENDQTPKDTVAPTVSDFRLTNPSGDTVRATFNASEPLDRAVLPVTYEDGTTATTFVFPANMSQNQVGGSYEYTGSFTAGQDGNYTGTLTFANDSVGNEAAVGQTDSVSIGPAADYIVYNDDKTATTGGTLNFSVDNVGYSNVTITDINVTVGQGNPARIFEDAGGTAPLANEVFVDASVDGWYDPSDTDTGSNTDGYPLDTSPTVGFTSNPVLVGGSNGAFTLYQFQKQRGGGYTSFDMTNRQVRVGLTYGDGSSEIIVLPK